MTVGVLALQGAFREHKQALERLGADVREVRLPKELDGLGGLVIPGGEATTMGKLIVNYGFDEALPAFYERGGAIWGTCAGAIVIANELEDHKDQFKLSLMNISVKRNAYGRQVDSFETDIEVAGLADPFHAIFIRAPQLTAVGEGVTTLASHQGVPVMAQQGRLLATVFHPELSGDDRIHNYFLQKVVN